MERVGPAIAEQRRANCILFAGNKNLLLVDLVGIAFRCRDQACSEQNTLSTEHQGSCQAAAIRDATCSYYGDRGDGVDHAWGAAPWC